MSTTAKLASRAAIGLVVILIGYSLLQAAGWISLVVVAAVVAFCCAVLIVAQAGPSITLSVGLALMMFSGNWGPLGSPLPLDRVVVAIGLAAMLSRADMRAELAERLKQPITILLGCIAAFGVVSAIRADTIHILAGDYGLLDSLGIVPFVLYLIAPIVFKTKKDRDILLTMLVLIGAYLGLTAFFETIHLNALVYPKYILNPNVGIHFERARGPFVEADANGLVMFECAVASAIAWQQWKGEKKAILAFCVVLLCAAGTVFTLTRAIWIASIVSALLTLLLFPQLRRYFIPTVLTAGALAGIAFVAIPGLSHEADKRSNELRPVWDRLNTDAAAVRMFEAQPLTGLGWYTFETKSTEYLRQGPNYPLTGARLNVHNVFLSRLAEIGGIGTALWLAALGFAVLGNAIRAGPKEMLPWRMGLVAVAIDWVIVANFVPLTYALPTAMLWLWAGLLSPVPQPLEAELVDYEPPPAAPRTSRARTRSAPSPQLT